MPANVLGASRFTNIPAYVRDCSVFKMEALGDDAGSTKGPDTKPNVSRAAGLSDCPAISSRPCKSSAAAFGKFRAACNSLIFPPPYGNAIEDLFDPCAVTCRWLRWRKNRPRSRRGEFLVQSKPCSSRHFRCTRIFVKARSPFRFWRAVIV